jgi:hypothetical protein
LLGIPIELAIHLVPDIPFDEDEEDLVGAEFALAAEPRPGSVGQGLPVVVVVWFLELAEWGRGDPAPGRDGAVEEELDCAPGSWGALFWGEDVEAREGGWGGDRGPEDAADGLDDEFWARGGAAEGEETAGGCVSG